MSLLNLLSSRQILKRRSSKNRRPLLTESLEDRRMMAVFAVSSLADSGPQTLRAAISAANGQTGADTIVFDSQLTGDIQLESPLTVTSDIEILGLGADVIAVDGMHGTRLFSVTDEGNLTIDGLTLENGNAISGGAIYSSGVVMIRNSVVTGNIANNGGAIRTSGPLTIESSLVANNTANGSGGAINSLTGDVTLRSSVLSGNSAGLDAGAVLIVGEYLAYTNFDITNTTFDGNYAGRRGGALRTGFNTGGNLDHATVTNNASVIDGGGIFLDADSGLTSRNSIISGNSADGVGQDMAQRGVVNFSYTLLGNNEDTFFAEANPDSSGNIVGGALGGLIDANLGNPAIDTLPHRPLTSLSPAINAGDPSFVLPPDFDGRGAPFARVSGGRIDMGAFEAQPRTFVVDGFGVDDFTLLEAIQSANDNAGHDTILFDPSLDGLTGGLTASASTLISDSVDILGPEHNPITVHQGGPERALLVSDSSSTLIDVMIAGLNFVDNIDGAVGSNQGAFIRNHENLTIRTSEISGGETTVGGGAIQSVAGTLELVNVQLLDNFAQGRGGAIWTSDSDLVIVDSVLSGNVSMPNDGTQIAGGAIYHDGDGLLHIQDTLVSGNTAYGDGGAIHTRGGEVVLYRSSIENNQALGLGADGGAIFSHSAHPAIYDSSITGNYARDDGGLYILGGTAFLQNTTVSGNQVFDDGAALLAVQGANALIEHSTVTLNTADSAAAGVGAGGGLFATSGATITVENSIVANNVSRLGADDTIGDVQSVTASFSLIGAPRSNSLLDNGGNLLGSIASPLDPMLSPLLLGASGTRFHGPLSGSPAIDAGNPAFGGSPANDQRGAPFVRKFGSAIDMGSIESQPQTLVVDTLVDEDDGDYSAGDLSLREAVSLSGGAEMDVIRFADPIVGGMIALTLGELTVTGAVHVSALVSNITIDAQGNSRIFNIDDGDDSQASDVIIRGLTLTGGETQWILGQNPTEDGQGGAIRSMESLTLADVTLAGNTADLSGGGLYAAGPGEITIERSTITGNSTSFAAGTTYGAGAAIRVEDNLTLVTIRDSEITGNGGVEYLNRRRVAHQYRFQLWHRRDRTFDD